MHRARGIAALSFGRCATVNVLAGALLTVVSACRVAHSGVPEGRIPIPGGVFTMGSPAGVGASQEHPAHQVTVAPFALDRTLVTVNAYNACVRAGACSAAGMEERGIPEVKAEQNAFCNGTHPDRHDHPINCVDWTQANAYCTWAGARLPTEEEWEYAAREPGNRPFPWGTDAPSGQLCWNRLKGEDFAHALGTCAVGSYPSGASALGVLDLAGNVWQWTSSEWSPGYDKPRDPSIRVIRGVGWRDHNPSEVRGASRNGSTVTDRVINMGFRCAR